MVIVDNMTIEDCLKELGPLLDPHRLEERYAKFYFGLSALKSPAVQISPSKYHVRFRLGKTSDIVEALRKTDYTLQEYGIRSGKHEKAKTKLNKVMRKLSGIFSSYFEGVNLGKDTESHQYEYNKAFWELLANAITHGTHYCRESKVDVECYGGNDKFLTIITQGTEGRSLEQIQANETMNILLNSYREKRNALLDKLDYYREAKRKPNDDLQRLHPKYVDMGIMEAIVSFSIERERVVSQLKMEGVYKLAEPKLDQIEDHGYLRGCGQSVISDIACEAFYEQSDGKFHSVLFYSPERQGGPNIKASLLSML